MIKIKYDNMIKMLYKRWKFRNGENLIKVNFDYLIWVQI